MKSKYFGLALGLALSLTIQVFADDSLSKMSSPGLNRLLKFVERAQNGEFKNSKGESIEEFMCSPSQGYKIKTSDQGLKISTILNRLVNFSETTPDLVTTPKELKAKNGKFNIKFLSKHLKIQITNWSAVLDQTLNTKPQAQSRYRVFTGMVPSAAYPEHSHWIAILDTLNGEILLVSDGTCA